MRQIVLTRTALALGVALLLPSGGLAQVTLNQIDTFETGSTLNWGGGPALAVAAGGPLDGDNDGQPGGDSVTKFHRMYGDANGDARVDTADLAVFGKTYLKSAADPGFLAYFDFNDDGRVDAADLGRLAAAMG